MYYSFTLTFSFFFFFSSLPLQFLYVLFLFIYRRFVCGYPWCVSYPALPSGCRNIVAKLWSTIKISSFVPFVLNTNFVPLCIPWYIYLSSFVLFPPFVRMYALVSSVSFALLDLSCFVEQGSRFGELTKIYDRTNERERHEKVSSFPPPTFPTNSPSIRSDSTQSIVRIYNIKHTSFYWSLTWKSLALT